MKNGTNHGHRSFPSPFYRAVSDLSAANKKNDLSVKGKYLILSENERGRSDGCRHSSTGISPRPMLVGASRNALRAFNARVSLTCLCVTARRLPPLLDGPVGIARSERSWRTCRPAQHRQNVSVCPMLHRRFTPGFLCQRTPGFFCQSEGQGKGE